MEQKRPFDKFGNSTITAIIGDSVNVKPTEVALIETEDCTPLVEGCKILADEPPGKDFRHVAVIPDHVMNRAMREGWFHDKQAWKRWANDPDNKAFRTWKGNL